MNTHQEKQTIFEVGKTYQTRGGLTARVICVDRVTHPEYSRFATMVTLVMQPDGYELVELHHADGRVRPMGNGDLDLLPPKWRGKIWVRDSGQHAIFDALALSPDSAVADGWRLIEVEESPTEEELAAYQSLKKELKDLKCESEKLEHHVNYKLSILNDLRDNLAAVERERDALKFEIMNLRKGTSVK